MKKTLLTLTLIFMLLAIPVAADTPYRLIVDDVLVDKPVVIINDLSYVPVRAIADIFNAVTEWDGATKTISIKSVGRPPIMGHKEFIEKINAALDLLEEKDFPHYVMVCQNTKSITYWPRLASEPETSIASATSWGETLIHPELAANPDWYTPLFLAGILVHEACHLVDLKYDDAMNREKEAHAHQYAVYVLLDAPQWMKDGSLNR
jgi:hypothetical protein